MLISIELIFFRFGNGQGVEFAESYVLEYFRPGLGRWARYRNREGNEVIKGMRF